MPKRILDGEGMWASDKIASLPEDMKPEYAWFYPLADANGSFEMNIRAIWARVSIARPKLHLKRVSRILEAFINAGLLFVWTEAGKMYAHWTGSNRPGRLPVPCHRERYEVTSPPVPKIKLREYEEKFSVNSALRKYPDSNPDYVPDQHPDNIHITSGLGVGEGVGVGKGVGGGRGAGERVAPNGSLPDWVPLEAWQGFVEMRKKIGHPLTDRAKELAIRNLEKLKAEGSEPGAVLDQSTFKGWRGLFEVKINSRTADTSHLE